METDILIYAIIAAVLVVWLRNILGTRNGDEQQRPNPYVESEQNKAKPKNIVGLDGQPFVVDMENPLKKLDLSDELIKEAEGLSRQMRDFDAISFVENAKNAFVMVVEAFAKGEKDVLEMLLAPSVYESFEGAIKEREKKAKPFQLKSMPFVRRILSIFNRKTALLMCPSASQQMKPVSFVIKMIISYLVTQNASLKWSTSGHLAARSKPKNQHGFYLKRAMMKSKITKRQYQKRQINSRPSSFYYSALCRSPILIGFAP